MGRVQRRETSLLSRCFFLFPKKDGSSSDRR
jgi:hypothetical protein